MIHKQDTSSMCNKFYAAVKVNLIFCVQMIQSPLLMIIIVNCIFIRTIKPLLTTAFQLLYILYDIDYKNIEFALPESKLFI